MSIFYLQLGNKKSNQKAGDNQLIGIILLLLSLFMDGVTNGVQTLMKEVSKPSADELMLNTNAFALVYVGIILMYTQEYSSAIMFCMRHKTVIFDIILFCLSMAIGQLFIFWSIADYGNLVIRKGYLLVLTLI